MGIFGGIVFHLELRHLHYGALHHYGRSGLGAVFFQFGIETLFGHAALVVAVLALVHGHFEELFVVLAAIPALFLHHCAELGKLVGIHVLRVARIEFHALFLGEFHDLRSQFAGELAAAAEYHAPGVFVDG